MAKNPPSKQQTKIDNPPEQDQTKIADELSIENEINLRKAQQAKKEQAKKQITEENKTPNEPIGGITNRLLRGFTNQNTNATNAEPNQPKSPPPPSRLENLDEMTQAENINLEQNKTKSNQTSPLEAGKELLKQQIKKKALLILLNPATWWAIFIAVCVFIIGVVLAFALFCIVMMYNCYEQKGWTGTLWTTYRKGPTGLLQEAFSGTCATSVSGGGQDNSPTTVKKETGTSSGGESMGGDNDALK
jgi:hypothetical protein